MLLTLSFYYCYYWWRYCGGGRHYHNMAHIRTMFQLQDKHRDQLEAPDLVALAIFFHDAGALKNLKISKSGTLPLNPCGLIAPGRPSIVKKNTEKQKTHSW